MTKKNETKQASPRQQSSTPSSPAALRFIETARALGCDESEAAFDAKLGKLARAHPKVAAKATKPKAPRKKKTPAK